MTTTHDDLQRGLGRAEGEIAGVKERMSNLEKKVEEGFKETREVLGVIRDDISEIRKRESERGAWWKIVAGIAGVIGGGIVAFIVKVFGG